MKLKYLYFGMAKIKQFIFIYNSNNGEFCSETRTIIAVHKEEKKVHVYDS